MSSLRVCDVVKRGLPEQKEKKTVATQFLYNFYVSFKTQCCSLL